MRLGYRYLAGQGVPQDYKEAAMWFRKAAEQGNADSQLKLGYMYLAGQGVPQDYEEAVMWSRKSAEQGNADSMTNLAWATATIPSVLNGQEAVKWGQKLLAQRKTWVEFDILAAAYARNGEFDMAVKSVEKSIELLKKEDKKTREDKLKYVLKRLDLYKKRQPYTSE